MALACPDCGTNHTVNSTFCSECGSFMRRDPSCHLKLKGSGKSCSNCGHPIREKAKFCTSCGTKVERVRNESTNS